MALVDLDLCEIIEEISTEDLIFELSKRGVNDITAYFNECGVPINSSNSLIIPSSTILYNIDCGVLIDYLGEHGYKMCQVASSINNEPYVTAIERFATPYDIKRGLCDLVGSSYDITNDDLLNKIKEVI